MRNLWFLGRALIGSLVLFIGPAYAQSITITKANVNQFKVIAGPALIVCRLNGQTVLAGRVRGGIVQEGLTWRKLNTKKTLERIKAKERLLRLKIKGSSSPSNKRILKKLRQRLGSLRNSRRQIRNAPQLCRQAFGGDPGIPPNASSGSSSSQGQEPGPDAPLCLPDLNCDDGLFCNGKEMCLGGVCTSGIAPCNSQQICDEELDVCVSPGGRVIHVSLSGSDSSGDGSAGHPYKTIQKGATLALPGDTVLVKSGVYEQKVVFNGISGTAGAPIIIQGQGWYPGAAHDRAITSIISGKRNGSPGSDRCLQVVGGSSYLIIRGLAFEHSTYLAAQIANARNIAFEDCTARYSRIGLAASGTVSGAQFITISRCVIHDNGDYGLITGVKNANMAPVHDILVEECDSFNNGAGKPEFANGFIATSLAGSANIAHNITFRKCLAFHNISNGFALQDVHGVVVEDSMAWHTTRLIDPNGQGEGDGRGIMLGLHGQGDSCIVRRSVSWEHPKLGLGAHNSKNAVFYNNTVFDNGFDRPGEVPVQPAAQKSGVFQYGADGQMLNTISFDNNRDYYDQPCPNAVDIYWNSSIPFASDYNLIGDQSGNEGPNTIHANPMLTDKELARSLGTAYHSASSAGAVTNARRIQFFRDMAAALRPLAGSSAVDAGVFIMHTASSGSGHEVSVDNIPSRYFRPGDLIQIDDADGDPSTMVRAVVTALTQQSIILDRSLTWEGQRGIHLAYQGNAPDIGAFEALP